MNYYYIIKRLGWEQQYGWGKGQDMLESKGENENNIGEEKCKGKSMDSKSKTQKQMKSESVFE